MSNRTTPAITRTMTRNPVAILYPIRLSDVGASSVCHGTLEVKREDNPGIECSSPALSSPPVFARGTAVDGEILTPCRFSCRKSLGACVAQSGKGNLSDGGVTSESSGCPSHFRSFL